jgi:type I restriction enzyme S subunit
MLIDRLKEKAACSAFDGSLPADWRLSAPTLKAATDEEIEKAYFRVSGSARQKPAADIEWRPDLNIPSSWRWVSVDRAVAQVQYGSSAKTSDDARGVPVLRMGNIQRGQLDWKDLKYLPAEHDEFPSLLLQDGDVLFNRTNSFELVGKSAVFRKLDGPASYASYLIRVRPAAILAELLSIYLNSRFGRSWIERVASQQVGQANVSGSKLKALGVPLPPFNEQAEILRRLLGGFARAHRLEAEAARARTLLDRLNSTILAKAFRGELIPQDPNDEPASILVERIRAKRATEPKRSAKRTALT